jgi:VIT1/CCC1 family predicted Fe2+/Mn2+ transporter
MTERLKDLGNTLDKYFKEIIYGGIDGIITTFAVVAGGAGASLSSDATVQISFLTILLFGLANLFADATSMGLGNFLSVRSEQDLYNSARDEEISNVRENPESEVEATVRVMMEKGFSEENARVLAEIYKTNEEYWVDFMMQHGREMSDPRGENPVLTGGATFFSFLAFGAIPLIPFLSGGSFSSSEAFALSVFGTFCALIILGLLKWKVIGAKLIASLAEVIIVGGAAAVIAYFVGTFFSV